MFNLVETRVYPMRNELYRFTIGRKTQATKTYKIFAQLNI